MSLFTHAQSGSRMFGIECSRHFFFFLLYSRSDLLPAHKVTRTRSAAQHLPGRRGGAGGRERPLLRRHEGERSRLSGSGPGSGRQTLGHQCISGGFTDHCFCTSLLSRDRDASSPGGDPAAPLRARRRRRRDDRLRLT